MDASAIRERVKTHLSTITGIAVAEIPDSASYVDDLGLDSLSLVELTVNLEYSFKIKVPMDRLAEVRTIDDTVRLVQEYVGLAGV